MFQNAIINTRTGPMEIVQATNSTTAGTAVADPIDTLTNPLTTAGVLATGVLNLGAGGVASCNGIKLLPIGVGSATTFLLGVYAMERLTCKGQTASLQDSWTHHILGGFLCTLGTKAGLAGSPNASTNFYAGTIALSGTLGNANISHEIVSPASNLAAHIVIDTKGAEFVKVLFWMNASSTSANAFWKRI